MNFLRFVKGERGRLSGERSGYVKKENGPIAIEKKKEEETTKGV